MSTKRKTNKAPARAEAQPVIMNREDARRFAQVTQHIQENAAAFEEFVQAGALSTLDHTNVMVLVNAGDEVGRSFIVDQLGLSPPPMPGTLAYLRGRVHLEAVWGLFVVPKDVFTSPLRLALDEPAPFGCCTVVVIEEAGVCLAAWSPGARAQAQA